MKKLITLLLSIAVASLLIAAAATATVETKLARIQTDPNSGDDPVATAYFSQTTTVGDQKFEAPWTSVSWRLKDTEKTVTVGDLTLAYAQVSQFVTAIADKEHAAMLAAKAAAAIPAPTPEPNL
jgi:P pilus assembly chaperone PapD